MNLFVVNSNYPFGKTETFLENEIKHIHDSFNKVYLFPLNYPSGDTTTRKTPNNVLAFPPVMSESNIDRVCQGVFSKFPYSLNFREIQNIFRSGSKNLSDKFKRWFIETIILRAFFSSSSYSFLKKELEEDDILYFYWCRKTVYFADVLNHKNTFIRLHGGEIDLDRYDNYIPYYNKILNSDVVVLPISNKAKTQLLKFRPNTHNKISRLGTFDYGINPELQSKRQPITLVSCSNLIPLKRIHLIIEALKCVSNYKIRWTHFGDGPEMEKLIEKANSELSNSIKFKFKGRVKNQKVLKYYSDNHIDLFINVSKSEGLPVSIMEAMSFGIPCFATSVGATAELVNNENGILAEKNFDIDSLVRAIKSVRAYSHIKKRKKARKKWNKDYRADKNYQKLACILLAGNTGSLKE